MKTKKGKHLLLALCLAAALLLASCGPKHAPAKDAAGDASADSSAVSDEEETAETQTFQGTVNLLDRELELLVLVADDVYYKFDTGKADLTDLAPEDDVVVTYTGTLEANSDFVSAVLVSIDRANQ